MEALKHSLRSRIEEAFLREKSALKEKSQGCEESVESKVNSFIDKNISKISNFVSVHPMIELISERKSLAQVTRIFSSGKLLSFFCLYSILF